MLRTILTTSLVFALTGAAAQAQFVCASVPVKTSGDIKISGNTIKQSTGKTYKKLSTKIDTEVADNCKYNWTNSLDNWLYGDDSFLYAKSYSKSGREKAGKTRTQVIPQNYRCTNDGVLVGYFGFGVTGASLINLEFLCTLEAEQGNGYGHQMMNHAGVEANGVFTKNQGFSMSLIAHPGAVGFYNGLNMRCNVESEEGKTRNVYQASITQNPLGEIKRKRTCYVAGEIGTGANQKIDYSANCLTSTEYDEFLDLNRQLEGLGHFQDVIRQSCETTGTITYTETRKNIEDYLEQQGN